jgi:hypothetical protein
MVAGIRVREEKANPMRVCEIFNSGRRAGLERLARDCVARFRFIGASFLPEDMMKHTMR